MRIIMGLGNPGEKYKNTRHNAGFMVLDQLAESMRANWQTNKKFKADIVKDGDVYAKPLTYMNNSGQAASSLLNFYHLQPRAWGIVTRKNSDLSSVLTVIHDDIDIELGKYKISLGSGSAGHKGVESIIKHLKTKNFCRIRVGIKSERPAELTTEKFVLAIFQKEELAIIKKTIPKIIDEIIQ